MNMVHNCFLSQLEALPAGREEARSRRSVSRTVMMKQESGSEEKGVSSLINMYTNCSAPCSEKPFLCLQVGSVHFKFG